MRTWIALLVMVGFAEMGWAQDSLPFKQQENVVYTEVHGTGLLTDIFTPVGDSNGLAIIDVVSGAWYSDRGKLYEHMLAQVYHIYCSRGYVVFAMRPGSVSKYAGDELVNHVKTGIRYVKSRAEEFGFDPNRIGIMGASAGGHLTLMAALTADAGQPEAKDPIKRLDSRVKAAAVFFPPTDFFDWNGEKANFSGDIGRLLFTGGTSGHSAEEVDEKARSLSPRLLVTESNVVPFLLIHGDADPQVPLQQSQVFIDAVKAVGGSAELIVKAGGAHPWPTINEEVAVMADWFDKTL